MPTAPLVSNYMNYTVVYKITQMYSCVCTCFTRGVIYTLSNIQGE